MIHEFTLNEINYAVVDGILYIDNEDFINRLHNQYCSREITIDEAIREIKLNHKIKEDIKGREPGYIDYLEYKAKDYPFKFYFFSKLPKTIKELNSFENTQNKLLDNFLLMINHCEDKEREQLINSYIVKNNEKIEKYKNDFNLCDIYKRLNERLGIANHTPFELESDFNNCDLSTIEDYIEPFKESMNNNDYLRLKSALNQYFTSGEFPVLEKRLRVNVKNKKQLGWKLKELYKTLNDNTPLTYEYLKFFNENLTCFQDYDFQENDFRNTTFYRYFTTNTNKNK